jgi:hypothetical protein
MRDASFVPTIDRNDDGNRQLNNRECNNTPYMDNGLRSRAEATEWISAISTLPRGQGLAIESPRFRDSDVRKRPAFIRSTLTFPIQSRLSPGPPFLGLSSSYHSFNSHFAPLTFVQYVLHIEDELVED